MKALAILTQRNEGAFLLEWLAHHRAVGFKNFVVFSNDCQDGSDRMLDRLAEMGWLDHYSNEGPHGKQGIQFSALKRAASLEATRNADWILPLDIDEFVNIHVGDHSLSALFQALPEADAIPLTWRLFGNCGIIRYLDRPITRQFTRAAPKVMLWPWRSAMFKTLYRNNGIYGKPGIHRPRSPDPRRIDTARWFDGSGRELDAQFRKRRIFSDFGQDNYALAQLNHYPLGAAESFVLKADRGRAVHSDHTLGLDYWVERNFCTEEDSSIHALAPAMQENLEMLKADHVLGALHEAAVKWRRQRFDQLLEHEPFRALFGRLLMTPPSRPLEPAAARFLIGHAQRSHARPQNDDDQSVP